MTVRDVVFPANPHALYQAHRYSPAIRAGGLLFVAGQVGSRPTARPRRISTPRCASRSRT